MGQDQFIVALNKLNLSEDDVEALLTDYVVNHLRSTSLTQADAFRAVSLRHDLGHPSMDSLSHATWPIHNPLAQTVDGVFWKWVTLRFGRPRIHTTNNESIIQTLDLNDRGRAALGARLISPRSSRFLVAVQGLPGDVVGHLECAAECWDAGVLRPAFIMLGLAFEELAMHLHAHLQLPLSKGRITQSFCLDKLKERLDRGHTPLNLAEKSQAIAALAFAKEVAERRNQCGHPQAVTLSSVELESWLTIAVPTLTSMFRMYRLT